MACRGIAQSPEGGDVEGDDLVRLRFHRRVVPPRMDNHRLNGELGCNVDMVQQPVEIPLPHTVGMWDKTKPVVIELTKGTNLLRFSHKSEGQAKGFSIKKFSLAPVSR